MRAVTVLVWSLYAKDALNAGVALPSEKDGNFLDMASKSLLVGSILRMAVITLPPRPDPTPAPAFTSFLMVLRSALTVRLPSRFTTPSSDAVTVVVFQS